MLSPLSRYQNAAAASREYAERFPERHDPGPRQLLIYIVQRRNKQDRTQNFRKQKKYTINYLR
jgi:hypothetical protein